MNIRSVVEKITPEIATKILEEAKENVQNRNVADSHVEWLAGQMSSGKWVLNGEAIILDDEGQLLDGQHRLWACVQSGVAIESFVTRGVDRRGFATIDTGTARSAANVLSITGEKNATILSAALGWVYRYEQGGMLRPLKATGFSPSVAALLARKHPDLRTAVEWSVSVRKGPIWRKVPCSPLAFMRYVFGQYKPQKAEEFFGLVGDVLPDQQGTVTRLLRDTYLRRAPGATHQATMEVMAITVKAWSAFLSGEKLFRLLWKRTGQYPESFPAFPGETESKGKAQRVVRLVAR